MATSVPAKKTIPARRAIASPAPAPVAAALTNTTQLADSGAVVERTEGENIHLGVKSELSGEVVTVIVPRPFKITRDNGEPVQYQAGTQEMPIEDASHWFARNMGVKVYTGKK